jgi:LPXTG-motif cell wall-anchored protein
MSIFNRRYALLGWLTWVGAKTMMKRKAKQVVPGTVEGTRRPNKGAIAAGLAALGGAIWFWRRKSSEDELPPVAES